MPVDRLVLSDRFEELLRRVRTLIADELRPHVRGAEQGTIVQKDLHVLLGRAGLLGLTLPEDVGGGGYSFSDYLQVVEEIATVSAQAGLGLSSHTLACSAVLAAGTPAQREEWLPDMLTGRVLAGHCMLETPWTSDRPVIRAHATRDGDDYVISGRSTRMPAADEPDVFVVLAREAHRGVPGFAVFMVPTTCPEVRTEVCRSAPTTSSCVCETILFEGVRVPSANRMSLGDRRQALVRGASDVANLGVGAVATGVAQAALDAVLGCLGQGRAAEGAFDEATSVLVAEMVVAVESGRATYLSAARLKDCGVPFGTQSSVAELVATTGAARATALAWHVLADSGGAYLREAERHARESMLLERCHDDDHQFRLRLGRAHARPRPGSAALTC